MSTPTYIIISDSEDEYPPPSVTYPSETASNVDVDDSSSILGSPIPPSDGFIPEGEHTISTPTIEVTDDQVDPGCTPAPEEPMETDPSEDEEEPEEEEVSDDSDTADSYTTPPTTIPALHPHYYRGHFVVRGGARTRATAWKSVPIPHATFYRRDYRDIHTVTATFPATTTVPTTTIATTVPMPSTLPPLQDPEFRHQSWLRSVRQAWRDIDAAPSTFETGGPSTVPAPSSETPTMVTRLAHQERDLSLLRQDFGTYVSRTSTHLFESFTSAHRDFTRTAHAVTDMGGRIAHTRHDVATLQFRLETAERRISALEAALRRQDSSDLASTSQRPSHQ